MIKTPSHKKFFNLALPNVVIGLTTPLAGLIDTALLGHLPNAIPLAGVALASIIFDFIYWGFGFLRMGTTGLTAQAFGKNDISEQKLVLYRALLLALLLGILISLCAPLISHFSFLILSGEKQVEIEGLKYFDARIFGALAVFIRYACSGWLLGLQKPKAVLLIAVLLNGLNIVLDYIFIYNLNWGSYGAGLATMISEWVAVIISVGVIIWVHKKIKGGINHRVLDFSKYKQMITLNSNIMIRTLFLMSAFSAFTNISAIFGTVILVGNAILIRFLYTISFFIDGFAIAIEGLAGEYKGAQNQQALKRTLNLGFLWSTGTIIFFTITLTLGQNIIISMITSLPLVKAHVITYLPYLYGVLLTAGFAYILDGYFIGLTRGRDLRNSMAVSTLFGFVPLATLSYINHSVQFLWYAMMAFMLLRAITLWKKLNKNNI